MSPMDMLPIRFKKDQQGLLEKVLQSYPHLRNSINDSINTIHQFGDEFYIAGSEFFGEINKEDKLIKIISEDTKLEGSNENLFDMLFDGNIYEIEESFEYDSLLTFRSNASGYLSVFFAPGINEFYVAPRIVKKAYKPIGDNKFTETGLPGFSEGDMELFKLWNDKYKILSENKKDKPSK